MNRGVMMKRTYLVMLLAVCFCMLTGCSSDAKKYDKNTLVVKRNGSLEEIAV
jgi:outer membrane murein-binding lipoprotein Lpp